MFKLYLIIGLLCLILGCKKENSTVDVSRNLVGHWKLIFGINGFTGKYETIPDGTSILLYLNGDNSYEKYENGIIKYNGKYDIGKVRSIFSGNYEDAIEFDSSNPSELYTIVSVVKDTLTLKINAADGGGSGYIRIK